MEKNKINTKAWPEELDALKSAPEHHRLILENQNVRVLDTNIPPGERTAIHIHQWPATLYIISWSDFIRYDDMGNVLVDSRNLTTSPVNGSTLWSEPLGPHSLQNIGTKDLHVLSVEVKSIT